MQLTIGAVSSLIMEAFKWAYRKWVAKDFTYDFPAWVYAVGLAALGVLLIPAFAYLGIGDYQMPTDWTQWVVDIFVAVLGALGTYTLALKPLKVYRREQRAEG